MAVKPGILINIENKFTMKVYMDIHKAIQEEIAKYLEKTDRKVLNTGDDFAVYMNMVVSQKYSYALLREAFYKLPKFVELAQIHKPVIYNSDEDNTRKPD